MAKKLLDNINGIIDKEVSELKPFLSNDTYKDFILDKDKTINIESVLNKQKEEEEKQKKKEERRKKRKEAVKKLVDKVTKKADEKLEELRIEDEIRKRFNGHEVQDMVTNLIDKQIEDIVSKEVKKAKKLYNSSNINEALANAQSYYNKILSSEKILTDMKTDYTEVLSKKINGSINDKLLDIQNSIGGKWGRKILGNSKIASKITNFVNREVKIVIDAIITDKTIANVSQDIINTVNRLKKASEDQLKKTFSGAIAYSKKVRKAVQDKIKEFNELKKKYIEKMQAEVDRLKNIISEEVKKIEDAVISEISKVIKVNAGAIEGFF